MKYFEILYANCFETRKAALIATSANAPDLTVLNRNGNRVIKYTETTQECYRSHTFKFYKLEKETMEMEKNYREWRKVSEEMQEDGLGGSVDCGIAQVRKDFSEYAGLETEITFEEMLVLEEDYEKEQIDTK